MLRTMIYLLKQILACSLRIEHKLDILLNDREKKEVLKMGFQKDPITGRRVEYRPVILEDGGAVAVRLDGHSPEVSGTPIVVRDIQKEKQDAE